MSLQRYSEPLALQLIWKAIEVIRGQRQIANISRITKVIQREHPYTKKEIMHHILKAVRDSMVIETLSMGCKGSKAGLEQEGYWIPEDTDITDIRASHDWYCFKCHKPGELTTCRGCFRAYHNECVEGVYRANSFGKTNNFNCKFCSMKSKSETLSSEKKVVLNKCLSFITKRLLEATPELTSRPNTEEYMHYSYFITKHQDLKGLFESCAKQEFESSADFLGTVELIAHNCALLHGNDDIITVTARKMLEMCMRELNELALCESCYILSTTKPTKDWFCSPCNPPHKIVWAKQKGFEFWPAKVIQIGSDKLDVRFFGGHHERAWITLNFVKSIAVNPAKLQVKKTKGWNRACEEMKEYIAQTKKNLGEDFVSQIVDFNFDFDSRTELLEDVSNDSIERDLKMRAKKRKAEIRGYVSAIKKARQQTSVSESQSFESLSSEIENPSQQHLSVSTNRAEQMILESSEQMKQFGQKAKLTAECARTWCYATDCIMMKRNTVIAKQGKERPAKPEKVEIVTKKCNCQKRYMRKLLAYKASVNKMRLREKKKNLVISTLYIRQYIKEHSVNVKFLESEISQLKAENEQLKNRLSTS